MEEIEVKLKLTKKEKLMKKYFYFAATAFLLGIALVTVQSRIVSAEGSKGSTSENWMEKKMEKMTTTLGLSEEQAAQVKALIEAKVEKKKAIKEEYTASVKALLSDEQKVKYDEMKASYHKGSMKGSGHEHGGTAMKGSGNEHGGTAMKGSGKEHGGTDN